MKKFLSLVLALVMTMSLVTISAGATDFKDDGKINYEEAVSVMSAVKVIDGYADGTFNPQGTLTRGAAAKIICNLILGPTTAAALHANTAPFKDVPVDHTFAGYIAYCAEQGIISGYADGAFRPAATLTNYAFLKMLLGALGYDSEIEGFVGENWSIQVAKRALAIGLTKGYEGTFSGTAAATREEACLYALNTLKATMVDYDAKITANVNGATIVVGNSLATDVKWNIASKTDGNIKDDGYVQFAEKYFSKLELEVGNGIYGRPANTWKNAKKEIGTFTSIEPTYVYTESTEEKDVYKDLSKDVVAEYEWTAYVNGKEVKAVTPAKSSEDEWVYTGEGTVTEIYVDDYAETVTVIEFNYYMGQVSKVKSDDDGEYITVSVLSKGGKDLADKTFYVEGYDEDDYVIFTMDWNGDDHEYVIGEVLEPETVEAEVTRVETDKNTGATYLKADGEKYVYAEADPADVPADEPTQQQHMVYDVTVSPVTKAHPALNEDYILYLDPNGYVLGFKAAEETVAQYLYVLDTDEHLGTWEAKVLLPDGTIAKVELKDELKGLDANNDGKNDKIKWLDTDESVQHSASVGTNVDDMIWKYSTNDKGVYTLTYVTPVDVSSKTAELVQSGNGTAKTAQIKNGKAYIELGNNNLIVDKKTIFVDKEGGKAYTGYKEVPNIEKARIAYVMDERVGVIVFVLDGEIYDENSIYFMLTKDTRESLKYDGEYYWEYSKAYVNGEKQNVIVNYDWDNDGTNEDALDPGVLYKVNKTIDEQYIVEIEAVPLNAQNTDITFGAPNAIGDETFWVTDARDAEHKFDTDEDTVIVLVETEVLTKLDGERKVTYTISQGNIDDMRVPANEDGKVYGVRVAVVKKDDSTAKLVYILLNTYINEGQAPAGDPADIDVVIGGTEAQPTITATVNVAGKDSKDVAAAIQAKLESAKYTDINVVVDASGNWTVSGKSGALTQTFAVTVVPYVAPGA